MSDGSQSAVASPTNSTTTTTNINNINNIQSAISTTIPTDATVVAGSVPPSASATASPSPSTPPSSSSSSSSTAPSSSTPTAVKTSSLAAGGEDDALASASGDSSSGSSSSSSSSFVQASSLSTAQKIQRTKKKLAAPPALPQHQSMPSMSPTTTHKKTTMSIGDDDDDDDLIRPPIATVSAITPSTLSSSASATTTKSSSSSASSFTTASNSTKDSNAALPVRSLRRHPADVSPAAAADNTLRFSREKLNTLTAEQEQLLASVPPVELVSSSTTKGRRLDNRDAAAPVSSDDELPRRRPSRHRHSVEMACDLLDTIREDYREQVERAYWSIVQDRAMWDEQLNIIEVVPMAGTMKHKQDRFAFTFVRVDGAVVMRIDREDIVTLHVTNPSMVQKVILEQLVSHIGWHWAVLNLATHAEIDKMRHKKVNASGGDCGRPPLHPDMRVMQLIDASTGEWCDLSKPVRIRLPAAVAHQRRFWRKQNRRRARETRDAMDAHVTRRGFRSLGISLRRVAIRKKVMRDLLSESPRGIRLSLSRRLSSVASRDDEDSDQMAAAAAAAAASASVDAPAARVNSTDSIGRPVSTGDSSSLASAATAPEDDDDLDYSDMRARQDQPVLFHHRHSLANANEADMDAEELRILRRGRSSLF